MKIEYVSDVACPWCAVGLWSLDRALERIDGEIPVELHFEPFELNPSMPPEGEDAAEYIARKYGRPPEQLAQTRAVLRERGAAVGFAFGDRSRIWNTFDAHRLLHWAGLEAGDGQSKLKHALLAAYHARSENPSDREVLLRAVAEAGLDVERAGAILDSDQYAAAVRARERHWQQLGINGVPAAIVNGKHLISGGQPPEVFEQALRQIAAAGG
ncbi:MAG TPA: DsbA family oxidoreductase [Caldimonas sp.]|jgi:predicted DsbA family dithiol-disulfide isomerase|nr:DsbA family oxidoreductase [Caldimonas sp.]HEX4234004.1 DsbA family oxidoreductase [Caldimonas sp.]